VEKYGRARQAKDGKYNTAHALWCWITRATDTRSEYVIIIAFTLQQWLYERAQYYFIRKLPVF